MGVGFSDTLALHQMIPYLFSFFVQGCTAHVQESGRPGTVVSRLLKHFHEQLPFFLVF